MTNETTVPNKILIRGAQLHNLKNIDLDVLFNKIVGIAGVFGSGKSSLALGVLYTERSRRYLDALSTYTRRQMTQAAKVQVNEVLYVPASLVLHQSPGVPVIRSLLVQELVCLECGEHFYAPSAEELAFNSQGA